MIATQDNTILIDFDTYTFHKGDEIKLSYINPFYINVDNAPDVQSLLQTTESNTCGMIVVPEDTIIWNNQDFSFVTGSDGSTPFNEQKLPYNTADSTKLLTNVYETCFPHFRKRVYTNYMSLYTSSNTLSNIAANIPQNAVFNPCFSTPSNVNSNICWTSRTYAYEGTYTFPLTKSITLYMSLNDLSVFTIPETFQMSCVNTGNPVALFQIYKGDYTASSFHNLFVTSLNSVIKMSSSNISITNRYIRNIRITPSTNSLILYGERGFTDLYGRLHTFATYGSQSNISYLRFPTSIYPTVRSLHVPEGIYTADQLVNYINSNNIDSGRLPYTMFTAESNNNAIYIKADKPFIFNPAMTLQNSTTDLSTTFTTSHILSVIQQQRETFNITFTDKSQDKTYTLQGTYTPAEFLRKVHELTGYNILIYKLGDIIKSKATYNIVCTGSLDIDCLFFKFTDEFVFGGGGYKVINKVNLDRLNQTVNIGYNKYWQTGVNNYTRLTPYTMYNYPSKYMSQNGQIRMISANDTTYITTSQQVICSKLTNSCGCIICQAPYISVTGILYLNCVDNGDITYHVNSYENKYYAESSGTNGICLNVPLQSVDVDSPVYITVDGNVDCDFTDVCTETNNYNARIRYM